MSYHSFFILVLCPARQRSARLTSAPVLAERVAASAMASAATPSSMIVQAIDDSATP